MSGETGVLERSTMARWYIIHAYSGFENKVRDSILSEAERLGLSQLVESVEVPTETVQVRRAMLGTIDLGAWVQSAIEELTGIE